MTMIKNGTRVQWADPGLPLDEEEQHHHEGVVTGHGTAHGLGDEPDVVIYDVDCDGFVVQVAAERLVRVTDSGRKGSA